LIDCLTVLKLVSMPPSQRSSTKGTPARCASSRTISRAWRLVPTNSTVPLLDDSLRRKCHRLLVFDQGLFEVDDVDLVAMAEDERGHLGVPEAGLVAEMDTRLQHLTHGRRHQILR
jgi:hypothetical protein